MNSLSVIAERAGVSVATVSLALRGKGPVARSTSERIKKIAEEVGYRPNPLLASLATKRFRSVKAIDGTPIAIFHFPTQLELSDDGEPRKQYGEAIISEAIRIGYSPTSYSLISTSKTGPLYRELYHRMVQGVIISGSMDMNTFGKEFDWSEFSVVACARYRSSLPFHTVRPNIFNSVKMAFNELLARGYQRIGFAMWRHDQVMEDDELRHGAAVSLEYSYLPKRNRLPVHVAPFRDYSPFIGWVEKHKPDAVLGFGAAQCRHLQNLGYRIPEDLGFASLHLEGLAQHEFCSGLDQNTGEIARQSVLTLDQLIRNKEKGIPRFPLDILVPSSWNEGKTLRARI